MVCKLCDAINEDYRIIKKTKHSFCVIAESSLKEGHILIIPKRCISQDEISKLTPEEMYDLFSLFEFMQNQLNLIFEEDVISFKNSGKHQTQTHLHFHLLPSKGGLRDLVSNYENISKRKDSIQEEDIRVKEMICKNIR